jgi:hypothetical protein
MFRKNGAPKLICVEKDWILLFRYYFQGLDYRLKLIKVKLDRNVIKNEYFIYF